jgi:AcrR family transcriptional regulator
MARPRSEDKRNAILEAAIRVIVAQGLSGPTAAIAQEAGISNGALFTYFATKAELLNQLYLQLKTNMATVALQGLPADGDLRKQALHLWSNWVTWATANPDRRRALALLSVSDEITEATRAAGAEAVAGLTELIERLRLQGPLRHTSLAFAGAIMNSIAEATMDFMIGDPVNARKHSKAGFEIFWRAVS